MSSRSAGIIAHMNVPAAWRRCDCQLCVEVLPPEPRTLNQATAKRLLSSHGWQETAGGKHNIKTEKPG
jgi:hypothetical protein